MIVDVRDLPEDESLRAEVVVVGSGIAGAGVAMHLARRGVDVIMLESGREVFDPEIQALNDVTFLGKPHRALDPEAGYHAYLPPQLRGVSRVRQFGGTSNVWTGKWKYLQPSDFAERPWVPFSEWPLSYEELQVHYRAAAADYGFEDLEAETQRPELGRLRTRIADAGLKMSSFWWEESPTRTRLRFGDEMQSLTNLRVVLGATATELRLDRSGRRIETVSCRSLEGRSLDVTGDQVVLAMGAIETPRLLLASDRDRSGGIGNAHDLVGRFYSDHPKHHSATLAPGPTTRAFANELQYGPKPRFCVCFALDDKTQKSRNLLEHVVYLKPIYSSRKRAALDTLLRRPACRDGIGRVADYRVKLATEQVPNPESRVRLDHARDRLGMRQAALDWRFTEQDHRSLAEIVKLCRERFEAAGLGVFDFGHGSPTIETMTDAAHQMGTTRMAIHPEKGVVDTDCRVFGTDNLFVAGSAVFPTGPSYSPTFTILALARRLAVHLLERRDAGVL
ncbi:GMC family oxidoreductase [Palleronia sp. LCG004]|uniref:GMC family oxidoreductase n=1 Tax=Palleronia sp. LCG004 TaxID=3079304 RepID=UPI002942F0B0|nr:GMC family oxidoreductase [Palleronia sp. LCG004]WOI55704.1 GMC family oxidoreductase [Palleronia sp. LCG004]